MTDKEVMQMALAALTEPHPGVRTDLSDAMIYREKIKTTAEALRAALAQPEREWQNLTDEERLECEISSNNNWRKHSLLVEAKLKEKNT